MTPEELDAEKGKILLQYHNADKKFNTLRLQAEALGELLMQLATWMKREPMQKIFKADQAHHGLLEAEITPMEYVQALDPQKLFALADQMRETYATLRKLEQRKESLGLK